MNLLDKYMLEVGKHLPRKNRLDLQAEIRSTIEDMLADRSEQAGRPVDDALLRDVLQEYGAPSKVAAAYRPARHLIGPRLFPFFEMVLKIVLAVLVAVSLAGFGINAVRTGAAGPEFLKLAGDFAIQFFTALISAFGNVVLVFAILERVLPGNPFGEEEEKWVPADLEREPDPGDVKRGEHIFGIIFTVLGLVFLNFYPDLIGFATLKDASWVYVPALTDAFFTYLPWINLLGGLQILLSLYLLMRGTWQLPSRLINLALDIAGIVLAVVMLTGPALASVDPASLSNLGSSAGTIAGLVSTAPKIVLVILIVVEGVELLQTLWGLLNQRTASKGYLPR